MAWRFQPIRHFLRKGLLAGADNNHGRDNTTIRTRQNLLGNFSVRAATGCQDGVPVSGRERNSAPGNLQAVPEGDAWIGNPDLIYATVWGIAAGGVLSADVSHNNERVHDSNQAECSRRRCDGKRRTTCRTCAVSAQNERRLGLVEKTSTNLPGTLIDRRGMHFDQSIT